MAASAEHAPGGAHFQVFGAAVGTPVRWRLLADNNRELGRSALLFDDAVAAMAGIELLRHRLDALVLEMERGIAGWSWALIDGAVALAVSAGPVDRRGRAVAGASRFRDAAAVAPVSLTVMVSSARRWTGASGAPAAGRTMAHARTAGAS